jgi:hypothetical protein
MVKINSNKKKLYRRIIFFVHINIWLYLFIFYKYIILMNDIVCVFFHCILFKYIFYTKKEKHKEKIDTRNFSNIIYRIKNKYSLLILMFK